MKIIEKILRLIGTNESKKSKMTLAELWLSKSENLQELERRQQMISRGEAPWQTFGRGGSI